MNKIKKLLSKKNKSKIVSLTAYSKNIASILDNYCDIVLVGDSLGSVLYNYKSTRQVTLDMMIEHSKSVRMGVKKALMVVDMPHNTYRNPKEALKNAKKIILKTKCDAVKLEGGKKIYNSIQTLVKNKIPVMGHLGLLPQSEKIFKFKGKKKSEREKILKEREGIQKRGCGLLARHVAAEGKHRGRTRLAARQPGTRVLASHLLARQPHLPPDGL